MRKVAWGRHVVHGLCSFAPALLLGCTPPGPPEVPPAPAPPAPPASAAAAAAPKGGELGDPPGAAQGLGPFVPIVSSQLPPVPLSEVSVQPFGRGLVAFASLHNSAGGEPGCLVAGVGRESCDFLRIASWQEPQPRSAWRRDTHRAPISAWSPLIPAAHTWGNLSPGQDVVYGVRREGSLVIDTISDKGEVSNLVDLREGPSLHAVDVIETSEGVVALGPDEQNVLTLVAIKKGSSKPDAFVSLKIVPADNYFGASFARNRILGGQHVALGHVDSAALLDRSGALTSNLALAWVEVFPPPERSPSGVPFKGAHLHIGGKGELRPDPPLRARGPRMDRHGCGRSSRPLSDPSVEKQVHLMKVSSSGAVLADKIVKVPLSNVSFENADHLVNLDAVAGGVELNGLRFGDDLSPQPADTTAIAAAGGGLRLAAPEARPAFEMTPPPSLLAAAYDAETAEGIVVAHDGMSRSAQLFDGLGQPVGEPVGVSAEIQFPARRTQGLVKVGGAWLTLDVHGRALLVLTGPHTGKRIELSSSNSYGDESTLLGLLPVSDSELKVVRASHGNLRELVVLSVDVPNLTATTFTTGNTKVFMSEALGVRLAPEPGAVTFFGQRPNGSPLLGRLDGAGKWSETSLKIPDELGEVKSVSAHPVYRDTVLLVEGEKGSLGIWASTGQSAPLPALAPPDPEKDSKDGKGGKDSEPSSRGVIDLRQPPNRPAGPLLGSGRWFVPATAGDVIPTGEPVQKASENCPYSFSTGPRRVVLVCLEPLATDKLGARLGLRVLRP